MTAHSVGTLWLIALTTILVLTLQPRRSAAQQQFFPDADMMRIGVYYYPEAWPPEQWPRDIANIRKLNLEFVHMGEFAWAIMEPQEGHFDFDWLEKNVKLCADQGLKVVLCTPSATPPVWLTSEHPEVLMVDGDGRTMVHGSRQQANWSSETYRQYVEKIDTELGKRFGNNPTVWGWQIDNELSHYGKEPSYDPDSQAKFRAWLKNKYGTIDNLNRDWGNSFWSQMYQNFDQIRLPNEKELVGPVNPHAMLDSKRWFADEAADYIRFQASILRKHCGNRQWITTNFMHNYAPINPVLSANDLDIMTLTIYPVWGQPNPDANPKPLGFRLGDMSELSFANDFMRCMNGAEGVMELQPGLVNWGNYNPQPYPGAVHMWIMRSFALGAKLICSYRYREPRAGAEQYLDGFVGPDGVTPSSGGEQYSQAASEIAELRKVRQPDAKEPADYTARRTAILYNYENRWDIDLHKQTIRWDTIRHIDRQYRALKRLGCPVDVITEDKDFGRYPFLVVPAYQLVDQALVKRWTDYAQNGGNLILTCRTAQKDRRGILWEGPWAAPIVDLIGANIKMYDTLPAPVVGKIDADGKPYDWVSWGEILQPREGTQTIATYADQFYAGSAAAVTRKLGRGTVTYIGVDSANGDLEFKLIGDVFTRAGVKTTAYDDGFVVDWRDGFWVATNFTEKTLPAPAPENAKLLVGARELGPAGVAVWQE
jgi:beta-galactosidase